MYAVSKKVIKPYHSRASLDYDKNSEAMEFPCGHKSGAFC